MSLCMVGDCTRPGVRNGPDGVTRMCWGHLRRANLGLSLGPLRAPQGTVHKFHRKPSQRLACAAIAYAETDSTDDRAYELAWRNLTDAARHYVLKKRRGARAARSATAST